MSAERQRTGVILTIGRWDGLVERLAGRTPKERDFVICQGSRFGGRTLVDYDDELELAGRVDRNGMDKGSEESESR